MSFSSRTSVERLRYTRVRQRQIGAGVFAEHRVPESACPGEEAVQCDADDRAAVGVELVGEFVEAGAGGGVEVERSFRPGDAAGVGGGAAGLVQCLRTRSGSARSRRAATRTSAPKRRGPMSAANSSSRSLVVGSNRSGIGSPTGTRPMFVSLITGHCSGTSGDLDSHPMAPAATTIGHCALASRLLRNAVRPSTRGADSSGRRNTHGLAEA